MSDIARHDTIAALASARGRAGIAVVRLSGPDALAIGRRCFVPRTPGEAQPRRMILGRALDAEGHALDEALFVYFPPGASYTGEPVVELHLHGGPVIVAAALEALLAAGARAAEPGEFTRRAFLSGRLDLAQAEAVGEMIAARSIAAVRAAHRRLAGALSEKVETMRDTLAEAMGLVEAEIDFPDEDIGRVPPREVTDLLDEVLAAADALLAGHARARALAEGAVVAIAGRPNAGKSSLLNRLAGARRALVHEQPGTTRDLIEADVVLAGVPVRLVDTAGLRAARDEVERQGLELARQTIAGADLVVYLLDGANGVTDDDCTYLAALAGPHLAVWNKCDLAMPDGAAEALAAWPVSAKRGDGIEELVAELARRVAGDESVGEALLAATRQHELVSRARAHLAAGRAIAATGRDHELAAEELRQAANALAELVGQTTADDVLNTIFARFCVGK